MPPEPGLQPGPCAARLAIAALFPGRRTTPPTAPTVTTPPWYPPGETTPRECPGVLQLAWLGPDGSRGLVFVNISDAPVTVEYTLRPADYGLPVGVTYSLTRLHPDGPAAGTAVAGPEIARAESLLALGTLVIEVAPAGG